MRLQREPEAPAAPCALHAAGRRVEARDTNRGDDRERAVGEPQRLTAAADVLRPHELAVDRVQRDRLLADLDDARALRIGPQTDRAVVRQRACMAAVRGVDVELEWTARLI